MTSWGLSWPSFASLLICAVMSACWGWIWLPSKELSWPVLAPLVTCDVFTACCDSMPLKRSSWPAPALVITCPAIFCRALALPTDRPVLRELVSSSTGALVWTTLLATSNEALAALPRISSATCWNAAFFVVVAVVVAFAASFAACAQSLSAAVFAVASEFLFALSTHFLQASMSVPAAPSHSFGALVQPWSKTETRKTATTAASLCEKDIILLKL
mmetsp:Transcript_62423/g.123385  ORF Transcript_62423/g.123385 Transcript_62423/m.123385 type:complete len:216 (-) Transcript_62423:68-715(-)